MLQYDLRCEEDAQTVIVSVIQTEQELRIDGIAVRDHFGHTASVGPLSFEGLSLVITMATRQISRPFSDRLFNALGFIFFLLGLIQIVSMWLVFRKAGEQGLASIVPFYNMWVLADIGGKPGWMGLLMCFSVFIPFPYVGSIIGYVLWIIISFGVAGAFNRSVVFGIGLSFVPSIFYPILAFTKD